MDIYRYRRHFKPFNMMTRYWYHSFSIVRLIVCLVVLIRQNTSTALAIPSILNHHNLNHRSSGVVVSEQKGAVRHQRFTTNILNVQTPSRNTRPHIRKTRQQKQRQILHATDVSNVVNNENHQSSSSSSISKTSSIISKENIMSILSAFTFIVIDIVIRNLFVWNHITFPSSLGACGIVFLILCMVNPFLNIMSFLQPGATLLAKWLPVFFVPSLITLPLTGSIGNSIEIFKILSVIVVGFFFTLLSTSYSVTFVRYFQTITNKEPPKLATSSKDTSPATTTKSDAAYSSPKPAKVFSDVLYNMLCVGVASTGIGSIITKGSVATNVILTKLFLLLTTLHTFVFGARLPNQFKQLVHPLVTCTVLTWTTMAIFAKVTASNMSFRSILQSYKTGARQMGVTSFGPGDVLIFLLGPAVVSLAISMYEKRALMKQNLMELCTAISVSTLGGLYGTALIVRLLNIASPQLRLSLLSRNITSPLAMAIATILGGDISLAVSMVVITGLIGANFGAMILNLFGIHDAVARGLGIGAAAHGLGTAAFANEKDAFPFAAISMALTASAATVAVSIPFIRKSLLQLALGV